jgi:hypothetical protein
VVFVGVPHAAFQGRGLDAYAVREFCGVSAEGVDFGNECGQAVGLVVADVPDATDFTGAVGQCCQGNECGSQFAATFKKKADTLRMAEANKAFSHFRF